MASISEELSIVLLGDGWPCYKWKGASADMPASIKEATVVLDKSAMTAQVVLCPVCTTTLVIPPWEGAANDVVACDMCSDPISCCCETCSCSAPCHEKEHESMETPVAYDEASKAKLAQLASEIVAESGKRHSSKDASVLLQILDLVKTLGIAVVDLVPEPPVEDSVAESAVEVIEIAESEPLEEITFHEAGAGGEYVTLSEADAVFNADKREIIITPIRPGWGNAKDGFYYTESALKDAVTNGTFNSRFVKMYANHPSRENEKALPERSVWDWVSTMRETWWDDEKGRPQSRIKVYDDRFWSRAIQAPDEIAFSILGGGRSRRGRIDNREARIVESLSQIRSVDWVTEAGAGGAIERFAESAHEEFEMDLKNLTAEQLKEGNPELYEAIVAMAKVLNPEVTPEVAPVAAVEVAPEAPVAEAEPVEEAPAPLEEAPVAVEETPVSDTPVVETAVEEAPVETPAVETPAVETPAVADTTIAALEEMRHELDAVKKQLADKELAEAVAQNKIETAAFVASTIKESTLPAVAKNQVAEKFREATSGEGLLYANHEDLKAAIDHELADRQAIIDELTGGKSRVKVPSAVEVTESSVRESVSKNLADKWGAAPKPAQPSSETGVVASSDEEDIVPVSEAASAAYGKMAEKFGLKA